jgi:hypothetical protein
MVLLGVVQEVQEFQLKVSLPNHLQGIVPITSISPAYTAYLRFVLISPVHTYLFTCSLFLHGPPGPRREPPCTG